MKLNHIISVDDFKREDILKILEESEKMLKYVENGKKLNLLEGKILATLFFEPSTRTRLSFESAMHRLGGSVIGFADPTITSVKKKETTADTVRMAAAYADIIVIRHPSPGSARLASEVSSVPVINGGDGANQHPTQTLLDIFTIKKELGKLDNLRVALVGDLKYGRTVHSLCTALKLFDSEFIFISPQQLKMPDAFKKDLNYKEKDNLELEDADVVYVTRIQEERFPDPLEYERVKNIYVITPEILSTMKKKSIVMHPLPRVEEISWECDNDPRCVYFKQAYYGVATRMAILAMLLGK